MKKTILVSLVFAFFSTIIAGASLASNLQPKSSIIQNDLSAEYLFNEMKLNGIVDFSTFKKAIDGYHKIHDKRKEVLTLIDFTKPSTQERMFVFDMDNKQLLYSSVVSHGKNSGANYATEFSNEVGSYKSSLGFYITENTYSGRNGYSLRLNGLERGINDKAMERAIVVHGASYADPNSAVKAGRLGRSFGCPAIPLSVTEPIINTIKDGSVLFIYADNKDYVSNSMFV